MCLLVDSGCFRLTDRQTDGRKRSRDQPHAASPSSFPPSSMPGLFSHSGSSVCLRRLCGNNTPSCSLLCSSSHPAPSCFAQRLSSPLRTPPASLRHRVASLLAAQTEACGAWHGLGRLLPGSCLLRGCPGHRGALCVTDGCRVWPRLAEVSGKLLLHWSPESGRV